MITKKALLNKLIKLYPKSHISIREDIVRYSSSTIVIEYYLYVSNCNCYTHNWSPKFNTFKELVIEANEKFNLKLKL